MSSKVQKASCQLPVGTVKKTLRYIIFNGAVYVYIVTATCAQEAPPPLVLKRVRAYGIKGQKSRRNFVSPLEIYSQGVLMVPFPIPFACISLALSTRFTRIISSRLIVEKQKSKKISLIEKIVSC